METRPIPAPGYLMISGTRRPPSSWGEELWCQLRNGHTGTRPWPVKTTRWKHENHPGDVVAVKPPEGEGRKT